jgi:hypothetical protein
VAKRAAGLFLLGSRKSDRSSGLCLNLPPNRLCSPQILLRDHFTQWVVGVFFPFLGRLLPPPFPHTKIKLKSLKR